MPQLGTGEYPRYLLPKSVTFPPTTLVPEVDMFIKLVIRDLRRLAETRASDNLTYPQRKAVQELRALKNVVIKPSDKGGNVVLWPSHMYEKEMFRQLRDSNCYKRLTFNPLMSYQQELAHILDNAVEENILNLKQKQGLIIQYPTIPTIYLLPKIHKNALIPPGRPIVSGCNSLTEPICKWIDFFLKPLVELLPSYIKDSNDVLRRLDGVQLDDNSYLVTCDVESLYTSIRHNDGIAATKFFLESSNLEGDLCALILELLSFILTRNFFIFKGVFYLQLQGTAMGAACAPSYANLFLGLWERTLFTSDTCPLAEKVLSWGRYIDDILFIWQGTLDELEQFMDALNNNNLNIHLTHKVNKTNIEFLDIQIQADANGFIQTNLHRKSTSANTVLHASSAHPTHLIRNIPIGQFLRARRLCSTEQDFEMQARDLEKRFRERGYSNRSIKRAYWRAKKTDRASSLHRTRTNKTTDNQVRCILDYNSRSHEIRQILEQHWPVLQVDETLNGMIPSRPAIAYRRNRNLKDLLVRSHYETEEPYLFGSKGPKNGCSPCGKCLACSNILRTDMFRNSSCTKSYEIRQKINCVTKGVVYVAQCPCELLYVGMTTRELRRRVREHILDINAAANETNLQSLKTLPRHFKLKHNSDATLLKFIGIDHVPVGIRGGQWKKLVAQRETRWIFRLDTLVPHGLNEINSYAPFLCVMRLTNQGHHVTTSSLLLSLE
ncbi:uncharacterized protein LOC130362821 [Hyla sarda]|uniref:uncharacterized protein LOC130362821 n=1 Tax=Hyla sarda TaxID=327740 RepID=UPI0024C4231C|nr:uncharacterized protein LOC130362821 [Hyla sarda]